MGVFVLIFYLPFLVDFLKNCKFFFMYPFQCALLEELNAR